MPYFRPGGLDSVSFMSRIQFDVFISVPKIKTLRTLSSESAPHTGDVLAVQIADKDWDRSRGENLLSREQLMALPWKKRSCFMSVRLLPQPSPVFSFWNCTIPAQFLHWSLSSLRHQMNTAPWYLPTEFHRMFLTNFLFCTKCKTSLEESVSSCLYSMACYPHFRVPICLTEPKPSRTLLRELLSWIQLPLLVSD